MDKPTISIIAAVSENRAIGKDNKLLWHIPEDLKRFKRITSGHPVIMGRKTYGSMGRLLPKRLNIIITRDKAYRVEGAVIASSLIDAINKATDVIASGFDKFTVNSAKQSQEKGIAAVASSDLAMTKSEIFIIGGGQIYAQAIGIADKLYLTIVHTQIEGDTYFPDYSEFTKKVFEKDEESDGYKYTYLDLVRV